METYSKADLKNALTDAGIKEGDVLFFQSRLYGLGNPEGVKSKEELCSFFMDVLLEILGPDGTLVVPTYTTQVARQDEPYIVDKTIPNYGLFPEHVFNHKDFVRSLHPLVSVAATGKHAKTICRPGGASNFGVRSPFDMMAKLNAKNVFAGIDLALSATMGHYMEMHYGVPYIYNKILKWRPVDKGVPDNRFSLAAVRYLDYEINYDLSEFKNELVKRGFVKTVQIGGGEIQCVEMENLLETGYDGLEKDPYYFLSTPPNFDYGKIPYDGPTVGRESDGNKTAPEIPAIALPLAPGFMGIVENILAKSSPWQKKTIVSLLASRDEHFFRESEDISQALLKVVRKLSIPEEKIADYYGMLCADTQKEQMDFRRSGEYRVKDYEEAIEEVYGKNEVMEYYLIGIIISQLLWDNHWRLLTFARSFFFAPFCLTSDTHVEIGPGHGWFSLLALRFGAKRLRAFDVSDQSAKMTRAMLETQGIPKDRWSVDITDARHGIPVDSGSVDTFMAGEVLEHIPDPEGFLKEANRILKPGGAAYITTAANAPCIDHLYLFKSSDEIRQMIYSTSFMIERDIEIIAGMIGDKPLISYGAVLRKK